MFEQRPQLVRNVVFAVSSPESRLLRRNSSAETMSKGTADTEESPITEGVYCPKQNENQEIAKPVRIESVEDFMDWGNWADCIKIETKLISSKLFYFAFFSARGALTPFMSIYLKQLGLRPSHIGLVTGLRPLLGFPSGPLWGAIADRFKLRRILFYISLIGWLVFKMSLGFIPATKPVTQCPNLINVTHWDRIVRSAFDDIADDKLIDQANRARKLTNLSTTTLAPHGQTHLLNSIETKINTTPWYNHFFHVVNDKENMSWLYEPADMKRVFLTLVLLVIAGELVQAPTSALADAGTIDKLGSGHEHKYSLQRAWGSLGFGISAFTVGYLLNMTRHQVVMCGTKVDICDYMMPFYVFGGWLRKTRSE
ncbi:major facilitator superfamily domain-containing protein 6-like [Tubulanus polymorphus]|uniref:major facilitator superfamily domain-containing protein 6-like n=1 Tax=Tubulanus polymorphus TaxID=672921 RepID=UPI003DA34B37